MSVGVEEEGELHNLMASTLMKGRGLRRMGQRGDP